MVKLTHKDVLQTKDKEIAVFETVNLDKEIKGNIHYLGDTYKIRLVHNNFIVCTKIS